MFEKLLISNRGEIACRIIRTAQRLGIPTVAVYSEADKRSVHVDLADEAIFIGESSASESYLNIDHIVNACRETRSDAVHPGYGFLSENPHFVEALERERVTFVGPHAHAIEVMGDKIASKQLAARVGVPVIPGHDEAIRSADEAIQHAREIGYPIMLKASAGGGGKGLRIAHDDASCREGFERARSEAASSFGDDRILVEKCIHEPRHIEIQVLGDKYGNCIYLGERECSIQRRHQKVIEEAPSPFVNATMRSAMGEQAVALAMEVDYCSAGTVEFIVDSDGNFYFLEMNTRLQVEHPVTEMVTGLDLVELMLRIAAGERLSLNQNEIEIKGWAIESRVYAEDPSRNFVPVTGRLKTYIEPPQGPQVRTDSGVMEGNEIGIHYDPMLAKLITYGSTRYEAIELMRGAIDKFCVDGLTTNLGFLSQLATHSRFVRGQLSTHFLDEEYPEGFVSRPLSDVDQLRIVALAMALDCDKQHGLARPNNEYWVYRVIRLYDKLFRVRCQGKDDHYRILVDDVEFVISIDDYFDPLLISFTCDDMSFSAQVRWDGFRYQIFHFGVYSTITVLREDIDTLYQTMPALRQIDHSDTLLSPMPGLIVSISVHPGQKVQPGDDLVVIEAMKMENALKVDKTALISKVHVEVGETVEQDQPIIDFEHES